MDRKNSMVNKIRNGAALIFFSIKISKIKFFGIFVASYSLIF